MAWFLNGDWDCLTTPPGASVNDLPLIMEQIARAINERIGAVNGTKINWYYTDALNVTAEFPTAAQFAGIKIDGACVRRFLVDAETWQESFNNWYTSATFATEYNSTSWAALFAGLGAYDITKAATYAPNWLRLKRAISAKRWGLRSLITTGGDSEITQAFMLRQFESGDEETSAAAAWANILTKPSAVSANYLGELYAIKVIEEDSGDFAATARIIEETPFIYTPKNTGATVLGMRVVAGKPLSNTTTAGDITAPAIGGTGQMEINGVVVTGWALTSGSSPSATAFHLDTSATYEVSIGFSDGNDGIPSTATTGNPGSYIMQGSKTWLVDVQPALTVA